MTERIIEHVTLLMYALAAISGGLGGCAIASQEVLHGKKPRISFVAAYGIIGAVFGLLVLVYGSFFGVDSASADAVVGNSILAGAVGSITLASTNLSARWVLKHLGIEVEVTVKRRNK
jgi:hypothetical protein